MNEQDRLDTVWMKISLRDAIALYRILEFQYIGYEDREAHFAVGKIAHFVSEQKEKSNAKIHDDRSGSGEVAE